MVSAQHLLPRADEAGRVAAWALLVPDEAMREAIGAGRDVLEHDTPLPEGCRTLADSAAELVAEGAVTREAAGALDRYA